MSKKNPRVLAPSNLPTRLPIGWGIVFYLLLDKFQPSGWVWGAVAAFWILLMLGCIVRMGKEVQVDYFKNGE
jgi:hypothetical protein